MVFELVKNSLRAVQERFMDSDKVAPPIRIIIADGIEDVTIKVGLGFHHEHAFIYCIGGFLPAIIKLFLCLTNDMLGL